MIYQDENYRLENTIGDGDSNNNVFKNELHHVIDKANSLERSSTEAQRVKLKILYKHYVT